MDKILIIEDDVEINTLLTDFLKENGYVVYSQYDGLHVLDFLHKEKIDLIILDIMLPLSKRRYYFGRYTQTIYDTGSYYFSERNDTE